MVDDSIYYALQVFNSDRWDIAIYRRGPDEKKGIAHFVESTPRLSWMEGKPFAEVWAYLVEQKKLGRLLFSMTEENKSLSDDLFRGNRPSSSR